MIPNVHVVIPARYASSRLPGKPLLDLGGQPLVQRTYACAAESGLDTLVAADDERVREVVSGFGGRVEMTPPELPSGTDRAAHVAANLEWPDDDVVINLQVDEPFFPSVLLFALADALRDGDEPLCTLACPIADPAEISDENCVKVVCALDGCALYFSRAPIPWKRGGFAKDASGFLRHIGVYAYRVAALRRLCQLEPTPAERAESLEQLRALENRMNIRVVVIEAAPPRGIDVEADLQRARQFLKDKELG